jgi:hypothetical protein
MNVVSTIRRKPCCSTTYIWGPKCADAGTVRSSAAASRSNGSPTKRSLICSGRRKDASACKVEKWLPEW